VSSSSSVPFPLLPGRTFRHPGSFPLVRKDLMNFKAHRFHASVIHTPPPVDPNIRPARHVSVPTIGRREFWISRPRVLRPRLPLPSPVSQKRSYVLKRRLSITGSTHSMILLPFLDSSSPLIIGRVLNACSLDVDF